MSEFLSAQDMNNWANAIDAGISPVGDAATLREYAAVVEGVASLPTSHSDDWGAWLECPVCKAVQALKGGLLHHSPGCLWVRARALRGKA